MSPIAASLMRAMMKTQIALYRATRGRVGGSMNGQPILLLTTVGRKSGISRTTPLMYNREGPEYVITASNNGADRHPGWYYNLETKPVVAIQVGDSVMSVRARITEGSERDSLYQRFADGLDRFAEYQEKTERLIPVIALEPLDAGDTP